MSLLKMKVSQKIESGKQQFTGTVVISGLKATKIARKSDGQTRFATRSALTTTARSVAKSLGFDGVEVIAPAKKAAVRKAAKGKAQSSSRKPAKKSTKCTAGKKKTAKKSRR